MMILEITPKNDIGKASFRLGGNFLGKDKSKNCFVTLLSERDGIFTVWLVDDKGKAQQIISNADKREATLKITRLNASLQYRLTAKGAELFREIHNDLGEFFFSFFKEDQLSPAEVKSCLEIDSLVDGFFLDIGGLILVTKKKHHVHHYP